MSEEYKFQMKRFVKSISPSYVRKGYRYLKMHGVKQFVVRLGERFSERDMEYSTWFALNRATEEELARQRAMFFERPIKISVAVPVYKTPEKFLRAMIESVMAQTYPFWELCMVDASPVISSKKDSQKKTMLTDIIQEYMVKDERIRCQILDSNGGISENMNRALGMAKGEFVGFLDHDDLLEPDALFEMVQMILADETVDAVYTDEDKTDRKGKQFLIPNMKPDFNLDLLRSNNYICHFFIVRRRIAISVGGFHSEFDGAQDHDFIFRCTEEARKVAHVHKVLYHWRTHEGSTSDNPNSKLYAFEAGKRAVQAHLKRTGVEAEVVDTPDLGYYRVKYPVQGDPMVSILIPNKDQKETLEKCLAALWEKTEYENYEILIIENNSKTQEIFDYYKKIDGRNHVRILYWKDGFNFSAINNFAAKQAKGEYLVLLNNDTEIITGGWLKELLGTCQRPEVGMVGAKLYFPDDTVQSAGTIIGMGGLADHAFVNMPRAHSGYMHRASIQMDLSGVTAACAIVKKSVFEEVGGFEEELTVAFNDVDLGLKIVTAGYLIVYDPYAEVYHYESKSRGADDEQNDRHKWEVRYTQEKWADFLAAGDPCYNKNLTLSKHNFSLRK
ncbi:MAG: glycosyltransferase family 2 protein [Marvinbryantia sp.]|jgi:GT2 family glycosyltransferase